MDITTMPMMYYNHYITVKDGLIVDGFSDAFRKPKDGDILINDKGTYQFRLIIGGEVTEENPVLFTMEHISLYKYEDDEIIKRSNEEIEEERSHIIHEYIPTLEERIADLEAAICEMEA